MQFLAIGSEQLRREVVRRADDGHFFGVVAKANSSASSYITNFEVEGVFREKQDVGRFDIPVCHF